MIALPDMSGRTALVTGGSGGVGLEIARALAAAGASVVLPVRNRQKGERAIASIRQTTDADVSLRDLDLASLDSVRALARSLDTPIDFCVLNAGIVNLGGRVRRTADGVELHFATNFLGHFALTLGILPLLRGARVAVQLSTIVGMRGIHWDDVQCERRYSPLRAYASSKVALGLFAMELARRDPGVNVQLCHPGVAPDTGIAGIIRARFDHGLVHRIVASVGNPPAVAADTALRALTTDASTPTLSGPSGFLHLSGAAGPQRMYRRLTDRAGGARIWSLAESLCRQPG